MKSISHVLTYIDSVIAQLVAGSRPTRPDLLERQLVFLDRIREYIQDASRYELPEYSRFLISHGVPAAQLYCTKHYLGMPEVTPEEVVLLEKLRAVWKEYLSAAGRSADPALLREALNAAE